VSPWRSRVSLEKPRLVREYDCLDAVTKVELLEYVRDVCLDGPRRPWRRAHLPVDGHTQRAGPGRKAGTVRLPVLAAVVQPGLLRRVGGHGDDDAGE
jgi:hypothetical protein